ncbi:hypothetical protein, partial [Streptomyces sp. NPDC048301]|uniref:hypothetical protein n=1 Tax=Streptomyces sp. NPDC048301 TaxID=3155631 RepID=UPI00342CB77B
MAMPRPAKKGAKRLSGRCTRSRVAGLSPEGLWKITLCASALELNRLIELQGVLHGQLLGDRLDEAAHDHR